jgi:glycosyltransferase involved in cell wall biosynthesis
MTQKGIRLVLAYKKILFGIYLISLFVGMHIPFLARSDEHQKINHDIQPGSRKLKINLICYKNGVGLNRDITTLQQELTKLGHSVHFINVLHPIPKKADINIFIEIGQDDFFSFADKNYFIPNPEWCRFSPEKIAQFDMVLTKTKEGERIFKLLNPNTIYLGFTCNDHYDEKITKDDKNFLHLAGSSIQKGTEGLIQTWMQNPQFPSLFLIKHKNTIDYPPASNLKLITEYVSDSTLMNLQNQCGIHVCPSETEGFGYYIMEALSCGAVVVTTDAPPMNEFVSDKRCLVGYNRTAPCRFATNYYVDSQKLESTVADLLSLSEDELHEIGRKNREFYLENDRLFKQRLAEIFSADFSFKPKEDLTENVFTNIYHHKLWGENPSGEGSTPENTKIYRLFLQNFLKDCHIRSVVDIGCGDWSFSRLIDWEGIHYRGYDVFKQIIDANQAQFSTPFIQFTHGNALRMDLPKADLLICKDVLQHLPNKDIALLLTQLQKFKHCLIVNDVDPMSLTGNNWDVPLGGLRCLDLTKSPFNLPGQKVLTFTSGGVTKQVLYLKNHD